MRSNTQGSIRNIIHQTGCVWGGHRRNECISGAGNHRRAGGQCEEVATCNTHLVDVAHILRLDKRVLLVGVLQLGEGSQKTLYPRTAHLHELPRHDSLARLGTDGCSKQYHDCVGNAGVCWQTPRCSWVPRVASSPLLGRDTYQWGGGGGGHRTAGTRLAMPRRCRAIAVCACMRFFRGRREGGEGGLKETIDGKLSGPQSQL